MRTLIACLALGISLWSAKNAYSGWIELEGAVRETQYAIVMAAQEEHWTNTKRGWCRAHVDTRAVDERILEIELSWADSQVGIQTRDATKHVLNGEPLGIIESVYVYGPEEYWVFHPFNKVNSLTGRGGRELRKMTSDMECRPHQVWLSISRGQNPKWTHRKLMQPLEDCKLFRSTDGKRVRVQNGVMVMDVDVESDYSPVLFETNMNVEGLPEKGRFPFRETYQVAQDPHGVWYCKSMQLTAWHQGLNGNSESWTTATVVEYDSAPPPERMRLDYKTIGAKADTKVTSYIPGRSGSWKYGKGVVDKSADEEAALRESSKRMLERGFSKEKDGNRNGARP